MPYGIKEHRRQRNKISSIQSYMYSSTDNLSTAIKLSDRVPNLYKFAQGFNIEISEIEKIMIESAEKAMQTINIGLGAEGGIGIVIIAILLDRITENISNKRRASIQKD